MSMINYTINSDYIELCKLLKSAGLCKSGGEAKYCIDQGLVAVNGTVERRKSCKIKGGDVVSFEQTSLRILPLPTNKQS